MAGPTGEERTFYKSPVRLWIAGVLARIGIRYFDLLYGRTDLRSSSVRTVSSPLELRIRAAGEEDMRRIVERSGDETDGDFRAALALGGACYVALSEGSIAGYTWVNRNLIPVRGLPPLPLPAGSVYSYKSHVFPEHRGKKVFQGLLAEVYREMKNEGFSVAANLVDVKNAASIQARRRVGASFRRVRLVKLPGLKPFFIPGIDGPPTREEAAGR
ncbi:MAG: hypothetical protein ABIH26_13955 [Candidatus Eisenbacteria bacterium]